MENERENVAGGKIEPSYYIKTRNDSIIYAAVNALLLGAGIYILYNGIVKNDWVYILISSLISACAVAFIAYLITVAIKAHTLSVSDTALTVADNFVLSQVLGADSTPVKNIISYPLANYKYFTIEITRGNLSRIYLLKDKTSRLKTAIGEISDCAGFIEALSGKLEKI